MVKSVDQTERGIIFRKTFSGTGQKFRITQLKTKTLQQSLARTVLCLSCDHTLQDANPGSMCAPQRYQAAPHCPMPTQPCRHRLVRSPSTAFPRDPFHNKQFIALLTCWERAKPHTGRVENNKSSACVAP